MKVTQTESATATNGPASPPETPKAGNAQDSPLSAWERITFGTAHAVAVALLRFLSLRGLYSIGCGFGTLEWVTNFKRRRRYARALEQVLGRKPSTRERRRFTKQYFQRQRCDKIFYLVFDRIPRHQAELLLSIEPKAMIEAAMADGKGVYMAMSHFGAQHVAGMLLAVQGYKVVGVRDRHEGGLRRYILDRFDRQYPELSRLRVLYSDSYPRDIYRCLEEGYILGSSMDVSRVRHPNQRVEEVEIAGERRQFVTGPLRVAMRCGATVLQAFVMPEPNFRYRLEIVSTLIEPNPTDAEAAIRRAMSEYAATAEKYARRHPELLTRI